MALDLDQLFIFNELSEIIRWQNQCIERMKSFREKYPYLIPPNVAKMVEENLKENVQILYRELNELHKPPEAKRRHVCRGCHQVFFVKLPGGLCDECRSKQAALTNRPRYGRLAPKRGEDSSASAVPESETVGASAGEQAPPREETPMAPEEPAVPQVVADKLEAHEGSATTTPTTIDELAPKEED